MDFLILFFIKIPFFVVATDLYNAMNSNGSMIPLDIY